MTDDNARIKYQHLKNIIAGKYSTERFHVDDKMEEKNLDMVSNELLVSDAKRHLAQLIKARPNIDFDGTGSINQKKADAEAKIRKEAEAKAKKEAEVKAKAEAKKKAEAKAKKDAEAK